MQGTIDVQIKEARRPPVGKCALAYIMLRTMVKKNFRHSCLYPLDIDIMEGFEDMTSSPGANLPSNPENKVNLVPQLKTRRPPNLPSKPENKGVRVRHARFTPPLPLGEGRGEGSPTCKRYLEPPSPSPRGKGNHGCLPQLSLGTMGIRNEKPKDRH